MVLIAAVSLASPTYLEDALDLAVCSEVALVAAPLRHGGFPHSVGTCPSAGSAAAIAAVPCRVGPFLSENLAEAAEWLHAGAELVVVSVPAAAACVGDAAAAAAAGDADAAAAARAATAAAQGLAEFVQRLKAANLPRERIAAEMPVGEPPADGEPRAAWTRGLGATLAALRPVACCVQLTLACAAAQAAAADIAAAGVLKGACGCDHDHDWTRAVFAAPAFSPAEIGALHKLGVDCQCAAYVQVDDGAAAANAAAPVATAVAVAVAAAATDAAAAAPPPPPPPPQAPAPVDAAEALLACARTDRPDGLYASVVCDNRGCALGLVYSSEASVRAAVSARRGVYYSRSRGGLWRKGDTSGAWQALHKIDLDCDADAMRFTVTQMGAPPSFCHRSTYTCWGESGGLGALQNTLVARRATAPEGSYTKRLFDDAALLRSKLLEEACELAEATEPDHVASEAADVMYFALARCVAAGVQISDIERHLHLRTLKLRRRPGNAKPWREAAAAKELAAIADKAAS